MLYLTHEIEEQFKSLVGEVDTRPRLISDVTCSSQAETREQIIFRKTVTICPPGRLALPVWRPEIVEKPERKFYVGRLLCILWST